MRKTKIREKLLNEALLWEYKEREAAAQKTQHVATGPQYTRCFQDELQHGARKCALLQFARNTAIITENEYGQCMTCGISSVLAPSAQSPTPAQPLSTYLTDFLQKHPSAPLDEEGTPIACTVMTGYAPSTVCDDHCSDCWRHPLEDSI